MLASNPREPKSSNPQSLAIFTERVFVAIEKDKICKKINIVLKNKTYAHRHCEPPQEAWQSSLSRGSISGLLPASFLAVTMTKVPRKSC